MAFTVSRLIDSSYGIRLVSVIGRIFPRRLGYALADFIAGQVASRKDSPVVGAVRANQWVVRGGTLGKVALDAAVRVTLKNTAHSLFDLYHFLYNPKATGRLITLDPRTADLLHRPEFTGRGLVIVGLHISNFDLALQWLCRQGMKPLVLTIPNPEGGRKVEYELRKNLGMNLVPTSVTALRQAVKHLERGGMVLTGMDRPIPDPEARPHFFGRPASLPLHHIYLAMKAQVPVMIMAVSKQEDGKYHSRTSEPIGLDGRPNREVAMIQNAEKILKIAEGFIRDTPEQWSMSLPVWPEAMELAP